MPIDCASIHERAPSAQLKEVLTVDEREQREMRKGAGDAFAAAFELIATPALFGLLGWFIDSRLGLFPVFTLVLAGIVLAYETQKLCVSYRRSLDEALEQRRAAYGQGPV